MIDRNHDRFAADRAEAMEILRQASGWVLMAKIGSDLSIRAAGLDPVEILETIAETGQRVMADIDAEGER